MDFNSFDVHHCKQRKQQLNPQLTQRKYETGFYIISLQANRKQINPPSVMKFTPYNKQNQFKAIVNLKLFISFSIGH